MRFPRKQRAAPLTDRRESGVVAVSLVMMVGLVFLACTGLIIDGSRILAADRRMQDLASAAARLAAQEVDNNRLAADGTLGLATSASDVALEYLNRAGIPSDEVTVAPFADGERAGVSIDIAHPVPLVLWKVFRQPVVRGSASVTLGRG